MSSTGRGESKVRAKSKSKSSRAGLQFPVGRMHRLLKKGNYAKRVGIGKKILLRLIIKFK